jgi:hypothetical protein
MTKNWQHEHSHDSGEPHEHEPVARGYEGGEFVADPNVEAYVTTITMTVAHGNDVDPYQVVQSLADVVNEMGFQGVAVGVATVELRGAGGIIGL